MASRITHRNFEILIACISYLFIFEFFKNLNKKKLVILTIMLLLHLPYVYFLAGKELFINIF